MASLMEVPICKQLTDFPVALTKWERSLRNFAERTGGQAVPPEWKLPILFKMIPLSMMGEIKIKHKYTTGMDKTYEGFSKLLLEMAHEKVYDRRAPKGRGESDMDVDALAAQKLQQQADWQARQAELAAADGRDFGKDGAHPDYTDAEWIAWEAQLQ